MKLPGASQFRRRRTLLMQASLANILLMGMAAVTGASVLMWKESSSFEQQLELRARALAEFLASESEFALLIGDRSELQRITKSAVTGEDVLYVVIIGEDGQYVATAGRGFQMSYRDREEIARQDPEIIRSANNRAGLPPHIQVERVVQASAARGLLDWDRDDHPGKRLGVVQIAFSMDKQQVFFYRVARDIAIVGISTLTLAIVVQYLQNEALASPAGPADPVHATRRGRRSDAAGTPGGLERSGSTDLCVQ